MNRRFYWEDHGTEDGTDHAVLYGPEPYMVAAVVTMDYGDLHLQEGCWRVMSGEYRSLNFEEGNMSLPVEDIKRRVLIFIGNEIRQKTDDLNTDMSNVMDMLLNENRKESLNERF